MPSTAKTRRVLKKLEQAGFTDTQVEAMVDSMGNQIEDLVTKSDFVVLNTKSDVLRGIADTIQAELATQKVELGTLRAELDTKPSKADLDALRHEMNAKIANLEIRLMLTMAAMFSLFFAAMQFFG